MKIILVGPLHNKKEYFTQKQKQDFLEGQGQLSWKRSLERLGHQVSVFRESDGTIIPNIIGGYIDFVAKKTAPITKARLGRYLNTYYWLYPRNYLVSIKFYLFARNIQPEVILLSGGTPTLVPRVFKKIKEIHKTKIVLMSGTNPATTSIKLERDLVSQKIIDVVVNNDSKYIKEWEKLGATNAFVLPISSADSKIHKKIKLTKKELNNYKSDVCFVGKLTHERQFTLKKLVEHDFNIRIWGNIPPEIKLDIKLTQFYYGEAFGEKFTKAMNGAKIALNFQPEEMEKGGNMRTFEIPACGTLQFADRIDEKFFIEGKEYVKFSSDKDLLKKIKYYLDNEKKRKLIARNGYRRAHKEHTYEKRFDNLLRSIRE